VDDGYGKLYYGAAADTRYTDWADAPFQQLLYGFDFDSPYDLLQHASKALQRYVDQETAK